MSYSVPLFGSIISQSLFPSWPAFSFRHWLNPINGQSPAWRRPRLGSNNPPRSLSPEISQSTCHDGRLLQQAGLKSNAPESCEPSKSFSAEISQPACHDGLPSQQTRLRSNARSSKPQDSPPSSSPNAAASALSAPDRSPACSAGHAARGDPTHHSTCRCSS